MSKKTNIVISNIEKQCRTIIKKYGFKATVVDIVYRDWLPTPCPTILHKGYTVTLRLNEGTHIALINFQGQIAKASDRRRIIIDCLSSAKLAEENIMPSREVN